jgi:hypothetical protein
VETLALYLNVFDEMRLCNVGERKGWWAGGSVGIVVSYF